MSTITARSVVSYIVASSSLTPFNFKFDNPRYIQIELKKPLVVSVGVGIYHGKDPDLEHVFMDCTNTIYGFHMKLGYPIMYKNSKGKTMIFRKKMNNSMFNKLNTSELTSSTNDGDDEKKKDDKMKFPDYKLEWTKDEVM